MALTDSQYDEILKSYTTRQLDHRAEENARKEEIYSAIPRIKEIDHTIAISSIESVRQRLKGGNDTSTETVRRNEELEQEKLSLLVQHGYAKDYLAAIYTCPICQDTGRVNNGYCACFKQQQLSYLYKQSRLENILGDENFDSFDLSYYSKEKDDTHPYTSFDNMSNILKYAKTFVDSFDKEGGNLLFYGETGLGKTYLSNCIAKALLDSHHTVLYQSAIHLFETCGDAVIRNNSEEARQLYNYLYECDILIIDDLGTENTNSFVLSELYDILNTRIREKKSTLISTNLDLNELTTRYSDRTSTRIFAEYKVYNFYGNNIRIAKRKREMKQ